MCEPSARQDDGVDGNADDSETSWRLCSASSNSHHDQLWAGGRSFTAGPYPYGYTITALGADIDHKVGTITPTAEIYPVAAFPARVGRHDRRSHGLAAGELSGGGHDCVA